MTYFQSTTNAYYFIVEILLSMVEMLVLLRLYNKVYGRPRLKGIKLYGLGMVLMFTVTCFARAALHPIRPAAWPPFTVTASLLFLWCYPPSRQKKLLYSSILLAVSFLWLMVWDMITSPIPDENKNGYLIMILGHVVFWVMLEIVRRTDRGNSYKIPGFLWILLASITILSMAVLFIIEYFIITRDETYAFTFEIPTTLAFLFVNMTLFVFFDRFASLMQTEQENGLLEQQVRLQNRHYRELEASQEKIRRLHHEMNNYVRTAAQLAQKEDGNEGLEQFLTKVSGQLTDTAQRISTGNRYLDSILNIKLEELKEIDCHPELDIHIPAELNLSFEQSITIMGNLLDNAREALMKVPGEDRWLKLHLSYAGGSLLIRVENAALGVSKWKDGLPETTKDDSKFHGLGLKNVKKMVDAVGTMEVESREDCFTVRIVLYDL